jgi:polyphosphate kinase 2 (PPK2 family)
MNIKNFIAKSNIKNSGITKSELKFSKKEFKKNLKKLAELQEKLYADAKHGVVVIIQAMDTAGKDGIITHVMTAFNPQGTIVYNYNNLYPKENEENNKK